MRARISRLSAIWYLGAFAFIALGVALASGLANNRAEPVNANINDVTHVLWGDSDCDNVIDIWDVLTIEQAILGLPQSWNVCGHGLHVGTQITAASPGALGYMGYWGDFDCSRQLTPVDALTSLKRFAGITPTDYLISCPGFGDASDVTEIPIGSIPTPPALPFVGIDTNTAGNSANSLGPTEACRQVALNDTFDVDVVVKGVPPFANFAGGLGGFDEVLAFYPGRLEVLSSNDLEMITASGTSNIVRAGATGFNSSGLYRSAVYDLSNNAESGDGILVRYTMKAIGAGPAGMYLTHYSDDQGNPTVLDNENYIYPITQLGGATIVIGGAPGACAAPTPSPTPGPGSNSCANLGQPLPLDDDNPTAIDQQDYNDAGTISNMSLCLNIAHEKVGDLIVRLEHEDTDTILNVVESLGNHAGTCTGNGHGLYVYLTDDTLNNANLSMEDACSNHADVIGTFYPDAPFVDPNGPFAGQTIAGTWKVVISDNTTGNVGELLGWKLYFNQ